MSILAGTGDTGPAFFFDRERLRGLALERRSAYRNTRPYPHVAIDAFLGEEHARSFARRFPGPRHPGWMRRDYREQSGRLGQLQRSGFDGVDPAIRHLLAELSGMAFLDFLGTLTGIDGLIADPHFRGAGPSLTLPGGHLALHADFNRDRSRHLSRAVTVLYYLAEDWDEAWGGHLELWNEDRSKCEARYSPVLDRLIVMAHGDTYWHGHPEPLACPEGRFRASLAAYYFIATAAPDEEKSAHGAIWALRE
jgi:hypothetical protein